MKINEKNLIAYSLSKDHIDKDGYLHKKGEINKAFQRRWFVLKGNLLFYFEKKGDKEPLGVIILEGCTTELAESAEYYVFKLIFCGPNSRIYELSAESQEELESWMKFISRASYDYLKLMVAELSKQLEEIEEAENSSCFSTVIPPLAISCIPSNSNHRQRENPFNRNEEISFSDLWKCNESLQNASHISRTQSLTGSQSIKVNPSLPLSIPFRPAPAPPVLKGPVMKSSVKKKQFHDLHKEYGISILEARLLYTPKHLKSSVNSDKDIINCDENVENLIEL